MGALIRVAHTLLARSRAEVFSRRREGRRMQAETRDRHHQVPIDYKCAMLPRGYPKI